MSFYIRPARGIERTAAQVPVQAAKRYTYYPYRDGEVQQFSGKEMERDSVFQQAARSASTWLDTAKQGQADLVQLTTKLSTELHNNKPISESLSTLTTLLNQWESTYRQHAANLKPELWDSIEAALSHPASHDLGLRRSSEDGIWITDASLMSNEEDRPPLQTERMKRVLLGADGLLIGLKYALAYGEQHKAIDLLQPQLNSTLPYAAYLDSIQSYSPVPYAGLILNRYL